jgi:hypothetical protein
MFGFNFYHKQTEDFKKYGAKSMDFVGGFVKEIYDLGFLKIAEFRMVNIGELHADRYKYQCKERGCQPSFDEASESYEEQVFVLTNTVRIFLTAFLTNKIEEGTKALSEIIKQDSQDRTDLIARQAQWLGRLGDLLETVKDKRYEFFTID